MDVLLVHGLGRTSGSMLRLGLALSRAGHRPSYFAYYAWAQAYEPIVRRLAERLAPLRAGGRPYAVVGHSLGGLLLRQALAESAGRPPAVLVMLGTPNRCPRMARLAWRVPPFRWLVRECGRTLASTTLFDRLPEPDYPYLVVAGTRGVYGRLSPFGLEPNDGLVAVEEARLGAADRLVTVPAAHTFMMNHPAVRRVVVDALRQATRGGPAVSTMS
jgi:pimeloyl-ACP methyl ester carboxylesterase